ncbi:Peptidoglycan-binding domain 1 protein [Desulfatibacillum aliphaticivorans]|uniref:Peptidoglycan-binding domain 1 protein n=1 Tax=Desulfatibacillum aliphaticivorans TaxID=218208 RepID=B8FE36_DESAL|nr:ExeA family protein [Desulfatibacillum aliphaticivorans]ACL06817.1 Peptidoglycan-binding domain 1 protein [Desulfatibacillum aliphaticivorans]
MYYEHFGLKENPFHTTPDPRYLYLSRGHQEAMDHLVYGITQRKGFVMITGGVGTGKTTLLRSLLSDLDQNVKTALVINPFLTADDLLPTICDEFGIDAPESQGKKGYLDAINAFLLDSFSSGRNVVLLLDEAQNLSRDVLEQVRILSNLETDKEKLLQIVLVGQEELVHVLGMNEMRQLNERIVVRYSLDALDFEDVKAYIQHRMMVAGCKGRIPFTNGAYKALYASCRGIPRRINAVCDRSLLAAYSRNLKQIDKDLILQAAKEVTGHTPAAAPEKRASWAYVSLMAVFAAAAVLGVAYGFWQGQGAANEDKLEAQTQVAAPAPPTVEAPKALEAPAPQTPKAPQAAAPETAAPPEAPTAPDVESPAIPEPMALVEALEPVAEPKENAEAAPPAEETPAAKTPEAPAVQPVPEVKKEAPPASEPVRTVGAWALDTETSLAKLFSLYESNPRIKALYGDEQAGIVSFRARAEVVKFFQRPFRASLKGLEDSQGGHAVVVGSFSDGFVVSDAAGNLVEVSLDDFEKRFSGGLVWLIPEKLWINRIGLGDKGPLVNWIQDVLIHGGYSLSKDGVYGPRTSKAIKSFQTDFGIRADGVAGPTTIGLMYQLAQHLPELSD